MQKTFILSFALFLLVSSLPAQKTFGQEPGPEAHLKVVTLLDLFRDPDPFGQGAAIGAVVEMGQSALPDLITALQDSNPNVRECCAIALGKLAPKAERAIPSLIRSLSDSDANVRWYATLALGRYGVLAAPAVDDLFGLLYDRDDDVRWAAYLALSKIDHTALDHPPPLSTIIDTLEICTPRLMQTLQVPGVSLALIERNRIRWSKTFGLADATQKTPADSATLFEACSMSKPIFTSLALMLVDEGRLDLDRPLCKYKAEDFVSEDAYFAGKVTARMILAHTSGLPNWRKGGEEREGPLPIFFRPGTKFSYSGEGFYYLQRVVEKITGEPLADLAQRRLFARLVPGSASYIWTETLNPRIATGHDGFGGTLPRSRYLHANAAYTLYTTPEAFARMMIALLGPGPDSGPPLLSARMREEMFRHQVRAETRQVISRPGRHFGLTAYRGLGWAIDATITGDIFYHSGSNQTGFRCYAQYNPRDGSGLVIMTNGVNGDELWGRLIAKTGDW
ncbi:MAG TPA: serine hydrolase [bacterium]|nr:serine hydrolase [bacterium]HQG45651.1 serine hydrolase [bacterium]HQI49382.1 serine hydrolase [bacterium]HQJ66244.1 serine hydrolase [bacterium]